MTSPTPAQVQIIKSTVPVLAAHGLTITKKFYADMLAANPSLNNIFNKTHQVTGHQPQALAAALYAYAANIDNLGALSPAVELICQKHATLYIRPEQYAIVGKHLLETMATVLGEAATPEILGAWGAAYWQLANLMIGREDELYKSTSGWDDWKDLRIARKVIESENITSFYLVPVEAGVKVPAYKAGQYVSVNVWVEGEGVWQARQYSLSEAGGKDELRISVKREGGIAIGDEEKSRTHAGYVSNLLHDTKNEGDILRVSHPFGDFFLEDRVKESPAPVVLISAGVGLTCLMSMLNTMIEGSSTKHISWIQGARDGRVRAFKEHVDRLAAKHSNLRTAYFASHPTDLEVLGSDYDVEGRVDLEKVDRQLLHVDNEQTMYFVCGPTQFMLDMEAKLKSYGVPAERVKMELFGTGGVPRV
ncbi:globin-like protein [Phaeosphaeriaceae sp. PMI808]|nr:globin-like protein [Phaeosphaeriaceae sp. PMI808]